MSSCLFTISSSHSDFPENARAVHGETSGSLFSSLVAPPMFGTVDPALELLSSRPISKISDRFFMKDSSLVRFLAEETLYQVNGENLARHSPWFRRQLEHLKDDALPPGWKRVAVSDNVDTTHVFVNHTRRQVTGTRPSHRDAATGAIILRDIFSWELDAFLSVLYPTNFDTYDIDATYVRHWSAVLKIARRWECPAIFALAMGRVDEILTRRNQHYERLMIARTYSLDEWAERALVGLSRLTNGLRMEDTQHMLPKDVQHVASLREAMLKRELAGLRNGLSDCMAQGSL